jgi:peptidoglycan/LPS O-acetylase OafA/YrhL
MTRRPRILVVSPDPREKAFRPMRSSNNNFAALRFLAASMVLVSHAVPITFGDDRMVRGLATIKNFGMQLSRGS